MKTAAIISASLIVGIFIGIFISNYKVILKSEVADKKEISPQKEIISTKNKPKLRKESIPCVCGEKVYPYTSGRLLSLKELEGFDKQSLRIMRNEIFACH